MNKALIIIVTISVFLGSGCSTKSDFHSSHKLVNLKVYKEQFWNANIKSVNFGDGETNPRIIARNKVMNASLNKDHEDCFPSRLDNICSSTSPKYVMKNQVQAVRISLYALTEGAMSNSMPEVMLFAAAQYANQHGYQYITPIKIHRNSGCGSSKSYQTNGSFNGNNFNATTTEHNSSSCFSNLDREFILFNDPSQIRLGLFVGSEDNLEPVYELYNEGMNARNSFRYDESILKSAYKNYFSSMTVLDDISKKYKLDLSHNYYNLVESPTKSEESEVKYRVED